MDSRFRETTLHYSPHDIDAKTVRYTLVKLVQYRQLEGELALIPSMWLLLMTVTFRFPPLPSSLVRNPAKREACPGVESTDGIRFEQVGMW